MKKPDTSTIDQPWPEEELEHIERCPYCDSNQRTLAYKDVQDWTFYCAPGMWDYWDCSQCETLYLSPRPIELSMGKAYSKYYTHNSKGKTLSDNIKIRLKNECFYHWKNADLIPRLNIPKSFSFFLLPFKTIIHVPFQIEALVSLPKGKLLDVGCGSGEMLVIAKRLGWQVTGLEIDPNAVKTAIAKGVNVILGDYRKLKDIEESFDCIISSHVIEHVHKPLELFDLFDKRLKSNGVLLLSLPNANSYVRAEFGPNWRGLEAPRHLSIPTIKIIIKLLRHRGYLEINQVNVNGLTIPQSMKIKKRKLQVSFGDYFCWKLKELFSTKIPKNEECDFSQISAKKSSQK